MRKPTPSKQSNATASKVKVRTGVRAGLGNQVWNDDWLTPV
jgi:hypothetical protein